MRAGQEITDQEISWEVDGIDVHATTTLPLVTGPHAAVALVAGSGPTDRDWNTPLLPGSNGSGKLLAEVLSRAGFITVRYDKRASGPHAKENIAPLTGKVSMQSHTEELAGAVAALVACPEVDARRIYALTNSEGAIHALNYQRRATEHRFAGFVLTGVPGRPLTVTMRSQVVPQLQALPDGEELVRQYDATIADIVAGRPIEVEPSLPEGLRNLFASLTNPANSPFARELLAVDPAQLVRDVAEPILIVIGKKDIQIDWQADGQALEAALAGRANVTFAYPENANHVLKYEAKARKELTPGEVATNYNAADRYLDRRALTEIQSWLMSQAGLS